MKIKLNLWQQIATGGVAWILLTILATWLAPSVFDVAKDSRWLAMVVFGYFAIGGLLTAGIAYGVLRLGDND